MAAKTLGAAETAKKEQAMKAEFKPVQAATEPAAPKQADTKQKIKKQAAAAAKEDAPVSKPVTSPHTRPAQFYMKSSLLSLLAAQRTREEVYLRYLLNTLPRRSATSRASPHAASLWALLSSRWRSGRASV